MRQNEWYDRLGCQNLIQLLYPQHLYYYRDPVQVYIHQRPPQRVTQSLHHLLRKTWTELAHRNRHHLNHIGGEAQLLVLFPRQLEHGHLLTVFLLLHQVQSLEHQERICESG